MAEYAYSQTVNADALQDALGESSVAALVTGLVASTTSVTVHTSVALDSGQQAVLDGVLAAHNPALPSVSQMVNAAKVFAQRLVDKWQKRIILDGVVQAGQAHAVASALAPSTIHAHYGNLYALDDELALVVPVPVYLTAARIVTIRNEVRAYLGLAPL